MPRKTTNLEVLYHDIDKLRYALDQTTKMMTMQEQRESEEFHLSAHAFRPMWDEAKDNGRAAINESIQEVG